ncbi:hypothetical protein IWW40_002333 [Coemansia sp. RSA 1250]|nr:hypothetical protein IWW40_002333 [Coemansia sp. RSA 1250]
MSQPQTASPRPTRVQYKFVLLGESAVGKSSIVTRLTRNEFNQYNESTIGAAFMTKEVALDDNSTAVLRIWDTAGQERYKSLAPMYYRNAEGAVVVYDITQEESFNKAKAWISELQRQNETRTMIALVGNKTDLADKRTVSYEEGARYAGEVNALFFETSAQSGQNVSELFEQLAKKIPRPEPAANTGSPALRTVAAAAGGRKGSYRRFGRTLGIWAAGSLGLAGLGYYVAKDEIEAFDNEEPAPELELYRNKQYKGYPIIDTKSQERERLVVLGSGWGAVAVLKTLDRDKYNVVVVSPDNYFIFTPLLPSATVGTVEFRSVLESIRRITKRVRGAYVEAAAIDVDLEAKCVLIEKPGEGRAWLPYDRLVVGVGAQSITHGAKGLEFCHKLKTILDARSIRQHVMANFEQAMLPTTSEEEKRRLLTFVVCGGGPTGCEFAAELHDLLAEDLKHYFPKSIRDMVQVVIVQSRDHILNMMDSVISEFAEHQFARRNITVITNSRVKEITANSLIYTTKNKDGSITEHEVPQGFVLWSTGVSMAPFAQLLCQKLPQHQRNRHAITVDEYLRVKGIADGSVYALGDCATVEYPHLLDHINELFESAHHQDSREITQKEFSVFVKTAAAQFPAAAGHLESLVRNFDYFDTNQNGSIDRSEFRKMLEFVDSKLTALPALAQVANQEGLYLGRSLNTLASLPNVNEDGQLKRRSEELAMTPFTYHHRGTLAYLGRAAAADFGEGKAYKGSNLAAKYLWRSVYWSQQVSLRTRFLLAMDWCKELLFGRDLSKF